jgi:hypothetical protein
MTHNLDGRVGIFVHTTMEGKKKLQLQILRQFTLVTAQAFIQDSN